MFRTPSFAHIAHDIINSVFTDFLVLQFAAGRVGSLDQNEDTLVPFCTDIQQRTDAVCAEIAVDGHIVGGKSGKTRALHGRFAQKCPGITGRRGADVVAFRVRDDDEPLFRRIRERFPVRFQPFRPVHFVIGDLHLYGRNNIAEGIHELFIEIKNAFRDVGKIFCTRTHIVGQVIETRIQPHAGGILQFYDAFNETIGNHNFFSSL